jgi:hypothetical protein
LEATLSLATTNKIDCLERRTSGTAHDERSCTAQVADERLVSAFGIPPDPKSQPQEAGTSAAAGQRVRVEPEQTSPTQPPSLGQRARQLLIRTISSPLSGRKQATFRRAIRETPPAMKSAGGQSARTSTITLPPPLSLFLDASTHGVVPLITPTDSPASSSAD